ncbi:DUF4439 domain-containing protein [Arthrobacter sp. OV608]|uniref:DUF4439 domain-containing protein n=1 Tax=Arthrobacter sp. OV608 TaxID=1882768 RepID=UPI00256FF9EC|nr:DUF4439 domain-containing protein [Arthrobacter sp. OV608]
MKDDNQENRPRMRYFRYAVFSLAALLVVSLGFAFSPAEPPAPAEPPFSEQAREAAMDEALELRSAALELGAADAGSNAGAPAEEPMTQVVTLLTIQARALLLPGSQASAEAPGPTSASAAGVPPTAAPPPSSPPVVTVAEFAARLAASGRQRLKDAETADGGMARLLAGAGTAQLLAAERLGAAGSLEAETQGTEPHDATVPAPACPATPSAAGSASTSPPTGASLATALVAAAAAELETAYGYQAALTRLPPEAVRPASKVLAQHQDLAVHAQEYGQTLCATLPPQPPGYVLDQGFLDAPAAGLAGLEADTLPMYGDVVALADGATRAWALAALQAAARRAQHWGADTSPLPGLVLDEGQLPPLPE